MKKISKLILAVILTSMLVGGCQSGSRVKMAPGYETTPTRQEIDANVMGTPEPTEIPSTPTPEPLVMDDDVYTIPSKIFSFSVPQGWITKSENEDYVRFEALDQTAWFEATVESTAYKLSREAFENYTQAMLVSLYGERTVYELLDSQVEEGQAIYISTYQKSGFDWMVYDVFIQRNQAIYALSFHTIKMLWDAYLPGFEAIAESLETRTAYATDEMIYSDTRTYAAPYNQFTINIPMGWTFTLGQEDVVEGAVVDVISAPDEQAAVEVVAYDGTEELLSVDIGQIAEPIIKDMEGANLRFRDHNLLNDGRIRADWTVDSLGMRGFSFFWQDSSIVYILTFRYDEVESGFYQRVVYGIGDSFNYVSVN